MDLQVGDRVRVLVIGEHKQVTKPAEGIVRRLPLPREEWRSEKARSDRYAIVEFEGARFAALNPRALEKIG